MPVVAYCRECYNEYGVIEVTRSLQEAMSGSLSDSCTVFVYENQHEVATSSFNPDIALVSSEICDYESHMNRCNLSVFDEGELTKGREVEAIREKISREQYTTL